MLYAISTHLSIERGALVGMTAEAVKEMALGNGDLVSETFAQSVIDLAKEEIAKEAEEATEKATRKRNSESAQSE